jgi:hypothetical protein
MQEIILSYKPGYTIKHHIFKLGCGVDSALLAYILDHTSEIEHSKNRGTHTIACC